MQPFHTPPFMPRLLPKMTWQCTGETGGSGHRAANPRARTRTCAPGRCTPWAVASASGGMRWQRWVQCSVCLPACPCGMQAPRRSLPAAASLPLCGPKHEAPTPGPALPSPSQDRALLERLFKRRPWPPQRQDHHAAFVAMLLEQSAALERALQVPRCPAGDSTHGAWGSAGMAAPGVRDASCPPAVWLQSLGPLRALPACSRRRQEGLRRMIHAQAAAGAPSMPRSARRRAAWTSRPGEQVGGGGWPDVGSFHT